MSNMPLRDGIKFAKENNLTNKEMEVMITLFDQAKTNKEISDELNKPTTTVNHTLVRLRLKKLVQSIAKEDNGLLLYQLTF